MSRRTAKFVSAVFASLLVGIPLTTVSHGAATTAETCLSGPKGAPPKGGHWYYRIDRATKRMLVRRRGKGKASRGSRRKIRPQSQRTSSDRSQTPAPNCRRRRRVAQEATVATVQRRRRMRRASTMISEPTPRMRTRNDRSWRRAGPHRRASTHQQVQRRRASSAPAMDRSNTPPNSAVRRSNPPSPRSPWRPADSSPQKTVRRDPDAVARRHRRPGACGTDGQRDLPVRRPTRRNGWRETGR